MAKYAKKNFSELHVLKIEAHKMRFLFFARFEAEILLKKSVLITHTHTHTHTPAYYVKKEITAKFFTDFRPIKQVNIS